MGRLMRFARCHIKVRPEREVDAPAVTKLIEAAYANVKGADAD